MNLQIVEVAGLELTDAELKHINDAVFGEWKIPAKNREEFKETLFFFLKDGEQILAMGGLMTTTPVIFNGEEFTILGVVEVVATIKGKGYGRKVVDHLREYAMQRQFSVLGYTMPKTTPFYEKCGFNIETYSTHRFVYNYNGKKIADDEGQVLFYLNGKDKFMEKVLAEPTKEVILPTDRLW